MKAFKKSVFWSTVALMAIFLAAPQAFAQGFENPATTPGTGAVPESGITTPQAGKFQSEKEYSEGDSGVEYSGISAHRASTLIGKPVVSASGATVGTVHDLVLFEGGQVRYAIIRVDNRTEEPYVPVPFNSIGSMGQGVEEAERLTVDLDGQTLANAPGFGENELARWWKTDIGEQVHGYYGSKPFATEPGTGKGPESGIYKGRTITDRPYDPTH